MLQSANLPAPNYRNRVFFESGYNNDIIKVLNSQFPEAVKQCSGVYFGSGSLKDKGRAIYNFLRTRVDYKKDPDGKQLIQLPSRLIRGTKKGDCKSLNLAAAAFMYCAGFKNVRLRYASYSASDSTPSHVYAVGNDENGKEIIIDAVYKYFNKEVPYQSKKDYKMQISVLSGTPEPLGIVVQRKAQNIVNKKLTPGAMQIKKKPGANIDNLLTKVRPGGFYFNVITNEKNRRKGQPSNITYTPTQLAAYLNKVQKHANARTGVIKSILNNEANALRNGAFTGTIYMERSGPAIRGLEEEIGKLSLKKIRKGIKKTTSKVLKKISPKNLLKGVKAVSLIAPRKAFLLLLRLNVRGLATRLKKLPESQLKKLWVDTFAGNLSTLKITLNAGAKKKPLFGASKKVKSIKGIGIVIDDSDNIGVTPFAAAGGAGAAAAAAAVPGAGQSIATIIAAAAPVLIVIVKALKKAGIQEVPEASKSSENSNFTEAEGAASESASGLSSWIDKAVDIAQATGIIPDKPDTPAEAQVNNVVPGDDFSGDPSGPDAGTKFKIAPVLLAGGLVATYLLLRKNKK